MLLNIIDAMPFDDVCAELHRSRNAVSMRLKFLEDHEIVQGADGAMVHRRTPVPERFAPSIVAAMMRDPPSYQSALGQRVMNETLG